MQHTTVPVLISALLMALGLTSCATPEELQANARGLDDRSLCMAWMTTHPMNQYQDARLHEIRRRGLDCNRFGNVAEERRKANEPLVDIYRRGAGLPTSSQQVQQNQTPMGVTQCVNRGMGVVECTTPRGIQRCTVSGPVMNCN